MPTQDEFSKSPKQTIEELTSRLETYMKQCEALKVEIEKVRKENAKLKSRDKQLQEALVTADRVGRKNALTALLKNKLVKGTVIEPILRAEFERLGGNEEV